MAIKRFPVDESQVMLFARAIGDDNLIFRDPVYAAGLEFGAIIAPPTFVQSGAHFDAEYHLRPRPGEAWFGSGASPTGVTERTPGGLHAEQHYEYHRPLTVGTVLTAITVPGRSWQKEGRSGTLDFNERVVEYRDSDGQLVVTARTVGVRTIPRSEA